MPIFQIQARGFYGFVTGKSAFLIRGLGNQETRKNKIELTLNPW